MPVALAIVRYGAVFAIFNINDFETVRGFYQSAFRCVGSIVQPVFIDDEMIADDRIIIGRWNIRTFRIGIRFEKEGIEPSVIYFTFRDGIGKGACFETGRDFPACGILIDNHERVGTGMIRVSTGSRIRSGRSRLGDFRRISPGCDHCLNVGYAQIGGSLVIGFSHRIDDGRVQNKFFVTADRGEIAVVKCDMDGASISCLYGIVEFYCITGAQLPGDASGIGNRYRTDQSSDYSCGHDSPRFR